MKALIATIVIAIAVSSVAQQTNPLDAYRQSYEKHEQAYLIRYEQTLDKIVAGLKKAGDLDNLLIVQTEKKRFDSEKTAPPLKDAKDSFRPAAEVYFQAMALLQEQYVKTLDELIKNEVKADRIEQAKLIKVEKDKISLSLANMKSNLPANKTVKPAGIQTTITTKTVAVETRETFLGTWMVSYPDGTQINFTLSPDGTALKTPGNIPGRWTIRQGAWITWQDGWRDNVQLGAEPVNLTYAPRAPTSRPPTNKGTVTRK